MDERFRESWFNREHVVLGRQLHPFCLYDALILSEFQSPFIVEQSKDKPSVYTLEDLQTAVLVCSSSPEVFLGAKLIRFRWDVLRMWWFGVRSRRICSSLEAFRHQGKLFGAYLRDYSSPPEFWEEEDSDISRLPWILSNAVHLLRTTNMTREEIWSMPLGQVFWYSATIAIQTGTTKAEIMTPEEEAAMKELGYGE